MDAQRFRFGLFSFDVSSGELKREGVPVRLQAQPARVLAHLIRRAAEVVPREEMRETIWGGETFVDFERGLNVCIASIRTALGDDANAPRYFRTVHRQGYQFIAPVECVSDSVGPQISRPAGSPSFPWLTIAVAAGFLLAIALAAAFALHRRHAPQSPQEPPIVAVARFDNETGDPAINQFSEGLTDNVVVELTRMSGDKFRVIGNATILREPREHRNLEAIASALHAQFIVLGEVQRSGSQTRVLAHMIRMPEQTHVWVVRLDKSLDDPLALESSAAQQIASEFSVRVASAGADPNSHSASTGR
jgi:DNA-binding winged helix-turn-helix (wHTH) protein/TolB-like protein